MGHAYAYQNILSFLSASSFTWAAGTTTNRSFLNDGEMAKQFELASTTGHVVVIDLGAAFAMRGFALLNHNAAADGGASLQIKGADDSGITSNVVTPYSLTALDTTEPAHKDHVALFSGAVTKRYWQLTIAAVGSFAFRLGEIYGMQSGTVVDLSRKKLYGHGETEEFFINKAESDVGWSRSTYLAGPRRTKRLPFADLTLSERREMMTMWRRARGGANPLLWIEDATSPGTAATQECLYGRMQPTVEWSESDFGLYAPAEFELTSLAREVGA